MDSREAAFELHLKDWSQARISEALGVTRKTIERWKKNDNWDKKKLQQAILIKESTDGIWSLLNYQNKALNEKRKEYEKAAENGEGYKLIDKGDFDALQKLYSIIKKKDTNLVTIIEIISELDAFIESKDFDLIKKVAPFFVEFIKLKQKQ